MKKILWFCFLAVASILPLSGGTGQPAYWKLTPEAQKFIRDLKAPAYTPRAGRTFFICQTQFKYGVDSEYLHRWYDRPLRNDTSLFRYRDFKRYFVNPKGWLITAADVRLTGLDGMGAIMTSSQRERIFDQATIPGGGMNILPMLSLNKASYKKCLMIADKTVGSPHALAINGKKVIFLRRNTTPGMIKKFQAELMKKYGDKFLFFNTVFYFDNKRKKPLEVKDLKAMQELLRRELRVCDGFYTMDRDNVIFRRQYDGRFFDTVMVPLVHSVMAEPEFKNKYMAFQSTVGHENTYRFNYTLSSEGTGMYRGYMESVKKLRPDIVIITEWDEENENTFLRPTITNGFSSQRLSRYYFNTINNKKVVPMPGDDAAIPNLILSYRRMLAAGEELRFELVNVPDGGANYDSESTLVLRDESGKEVKRFASIRLKGGECQAQVMKVPVSELVEHLCIYPELQVKYQGKSLTFKEHLAPIRLAAVRNLDHKWVKHCLRDLPENCVSELKVLRTLPDGRIELKGKVRSDVPLRSVEVIDYPNTVYMYSPGRQLQSDSKYTLIQMDLKKIGTQRHRISVQLKFNGVSKVIDVKSGKELKNMCFLNKGLRFSRWNHKEWFLIPAGEIAKGSVDVDIAGVKKSLPLSGIAAGKMAVALPYNGMAVFSEMNMPVATPGPVNKKEVEFTVLIRPRNAESTIFIRTVDSKYRIHRGKALTLLKPSKEKKEITIYDVPLRKMNKISIAANRIPFEYSYIFDPASYPIIRCTAGRDYDALAGGFVTMLSGYGSGESQYGNMFSRHLPKSAFQVHPELVKSGDRWAVKFAKGNHVNLPIQFMPGYAGFEIEMEVMPETVTPNMAILSMGRNAMELLSRKSNLRAMLFFDNRFYDTCGAVGSSYCYAPPLTPGKWNHIKISYDIKKARLEVNGKSGKQCVYSGNLLSARYGAIGYLPFDKTFLGQVRKLTIRIK